MDRRINIDNYKKWIAEMELDFQRAPVTPGLQNYGGGVEASIANTYWEFGDVASAVPWYDISLGAIPGDQPLTSVAFLHWKAGRHVKMVEECEAVVADREKRLTDSSLESSDKDEHRRGHLLAYYHWSVAAFLLEDYETAIERAKQGKEFDQHQPSVLDAILQIAPGLSSKDFEIFEKGLRMLRKLTDP